MTFALFPIRFYYTTLFLLLLAIGFSFYNRAEYFDEAWFAEQSFWLVKDGQVRSELFRGYHDWEKGIYVFHKLFIYVGAFLMSIFGFSVAGSKLVSILFGLIGGYLIWIYGSNKSKEQQLLSLLLYFGCGTLIRYISVGRPETMCMALGFASYVALDLPFTSSRSKPVLAGVLAGLAALTHLNGIIYLMAGTIWLVIKLGWRSAFWFAVAGGITLSFYIVDALSNNNINVMLHQFVTDPATQQNFNLIDKLSVLIEYHQLFFYGIYESSLTTLAILCVVAFRKHIKIKEPILLYTIIIILSFWLLTKSITDIYFLLFVPWISILIAKYIDNYLPKQPIWQKKLGQFFILLYSIISITQLMFVLNENKDTVNIEEHNALLASHMPKKYSKVIAPIEFFFGEMNNYRILGLTYFHLLEREKGTIPIDAFFNQANQNNVEYVISDHRLNSSYEIPINSPDRIGVYKRIYQDNLSTIYERQQ